MNTARKDRFLTKAWNNLLTIGLGVPTLLFGAIALSSEAISDRATFIGLVLLGAFY